MRWHCRGWLAYLCCEHVAVAICIVQMESIQVSSRYSWTFTLVAQLSLLDSDFMLGFQIVHYSERNGFHKPVHAYL